MHRITSFFKKCEQNSIISFQFSVATDRRNLTSINQNLVKNEVNLWQFRICHCLFKMHIDTKLTYKHISDNDSIFRYCHV
jgi:hypothetical protein